MNIQGYWDAVIRQDAEEIRRYFHGDAVVRWHNTNEQFAVHEFIRANCEYPGSWTGEVERVETFGSLLITAVHVCTADHKLSFHAVSFIQIKEERIASIDEYWGDDGPAPQWRLDKKIGTPIF